MSLIPYTITALELNQADATASGKQVVVGASCSMYIQPADTVVLLYDDAAGSNGSTAKTTDSNGQVTVYIEPANYRLVTNSISRYVQVGMAIGSAALLDVTTSKTDTTPDRLTKVGDFGIGSLSTTDYPITNIDIATGVAGGKYRYINTNTGTLPAGFSSFGNIWVNKYDTDNASQILVDVNGKSAFRHIENDVAQDWSIYFTSGNTAFVKTSLEINTSFSTFSLLEASLFSETGKSLVCQARANALYIIQAPGYVALAGDATLASGSIAALQSNGEYNLKHFGPNADGTNDNVIIQSAIDRLEEFECLYIPPGKYGYTNLTITKNNISIRTCGRRTTKFVQLSATATGITVSDAATTLQGVSISGIWFAVGAGVERSTGIDVLWYNFTHSDLKDLYVSDPHIGIQIVGAARSEITDVWFRREIGRASKTLYAIYMMHNTTTDLSIVNLKLTRVDGVSADGYDEFFRINSADWVLFSNCHMNLARVIGAGGGGSIFTNLKITDSYLRAAGSRALSFENTSQIVLVQIIGTTVSDAVGNGIYSALENITNITISNTDFQRCGTGGGNAIDIRPLRGNILGNTFANCPNTDIALTRAGAGGSANVKNNNGQGSNGVITISANYSVIDSTGNIA